jgi:hypothetical protein
MSENLLEKDYFAIGKVYHKIYYESCDEFEKVRSKCLEENNWLRKNYTEENLVIEDHHGYCVVYNAETHEPIVMGGVFNDGRWPSNIARMLNRAYVFPYMRRKSIRQLIAGYEMLHDHMIFPLISQNNFDSYFITMQNRDKKDTKEWWNVWKYTFNKGGNNFWTESSGYVQTCPHMVQKCWQNFIYKELVPNTFNLSVLSQQEWEHLISGD